MAIEINCGDQGRVVIPSRLRKSLGLKPGDKLLASERDGQLVLEPANLAWKRLKQQVQTSPDSGSMAAELIAERRQEALRDDV